MTTNAISYGEFSLALHEKLTGNRAPIDVTLEITRRCPLECQHCYNNLPMADLAARNQELTKEEYFTLLADLADMGVIWLLFTGGEIFARRDFLEIYTFAKQKGFLITLFTNGILINEKIADYLREFPPFAIEITLYGRTRETYEALTQHPGSYDRCLRGIQLLLDRGLPLKLKTVGTKINRHEVASMKEFAEQELGVEFKFDSLMSPRIDCSQAPLAVRMSFDSGAVWTAFRASHEFVFDFSSPIIATHPYKRLRVDSHFRRAELLLKRAALQRHRPVFPLEYPVDELLFTNYLASGIGVEVHGCGLVDSETGGHLFLGHSGAGKSTTTMLWKSLRNPEILSDDRIILRLHDGELWMYGTPWHGEAAFAMPGKARINRIFILEHGDQNEITPLTRSHAVGELFARCFPPFHNTEALERTVGFLDRILDTVPCYRFPFVRDARAVKTVLGFHD